MIAQMMQYNFELKFGSLHLTDKPFSSTDINIFLNKAQNIIVDDRYSSSVLTPRHFEMDEKTRVEIGKLIANYSTGTFATGSNRIQSDALFVALPSNYLYSLTEQCVVSYTNCNNTGATGIARVLPITHDQYLMSKNDPFNRPYEKLVWRMDFGGDVEGVKKHELLYKNGQSITRYDLRYLRIPLAIDILNGVDCELHPELHEEIVDMAVNLAKDKIQNVQLKQQE